MRPFLLSSLVRVFCRSFPPAAGGRRKTVVSYTFSCTCEIVSKEIVLLLVSCDLQVICFSSFPRSVENNGFEPLTPCLQSRCSSQLS